MCEDNQPDYRDNNHHHHNEYSDSVSVLEVSDNKNDIVVEFPILLDDYDVIGRHENISYIDNGEVINDDNNTAKNQSMNIINRKSYDGDSDYLEMFSIPNYVYSRNSNTVDDDYNDDDLDHKITIINDDKNDKKIKNQHKTKAKKVKAYRNNNNHNNDANKKSDDINVDVETKLFNDLNLYLHDQQQSMIVGNKYGLSYDDLLMKTSQNMYFQSNDDYDYDDDDKANHHSHRLHNFHFSDGDDYNHEKRIHKSVQFSTNIISDKKNAKHKMKYNHHYHNHGDDSDSSGSKSTKIKVNFNSGTITHNIIVITITIIVVVVIIIITIFITIITNIIIMIMMIIT